MSVNRYMPHVLVLAEDDANNQIANGFLLGPTLQTRRIQILTEAGGWARVRDVFVSEHCVGMRRYPDRYMVLLIDFDSNTNRLNDIKEAIPDDLIDRVFVLGALTNPEELRHACGNTYETIGKAMAQDCRDGTQALWAHELLRHNEDELARLRNVACGVLFPA